MNLLHPLTSFYWKKHSRFTEGKTDIVWQGAHCVLLNSKIYVGNSTTLHECSADLSSWKQLSKFLPVYQYALTTYQDRLVLVGGTSKSSKVPQTTVHSAKLWMTDNGQTWDSSLLTPLPTKRTYVAAFNTGTPGECLVVAGGLETNRNKEVDKVEVLIGKQWVSLSPLPHIAHMLRPVVHNGNVIFSSMECCSSFYCKLAELKAECKLARKNSNTSTAPAWHELTGDYKSSCFLSYKNQLLHFMPTKLTCYVVKIYSRTGNDWFPIAYLPDKWSPQAAVVGPTGKIVVVVMDLQEGDCSLVTGSMRGNTLQ